MRQQAITLRAERGDILDREGRPLAVSTRAGDLVCDPVAVTNPEEAARLTSAIVGLPEAEVLARLRPQPMANGRVDRHVVLQKNLDPEKIVAFRVALEDKSRAAAMKGVFVDEKPDRTYPAGREAVHVVGIVQPGPGGKARGTMGIEQSFDAELRGSEGFMRAEVDAKRRVIPDTQSDRLDARDGADVRLTIDSTIQHIAETELEKACIENKPVSGMAIVMDPKTGDVLAMASWPSFDPHSKTELYASKTLAPMANHTLSLYEPGSTLKLLTAAAALETGVVTPSTVLPCAGMLRIGNKYVKCASHGGSRAHGPSDMRRILEQSCNVGTSQLGMKLGMDRMADWLGRFNMLSETGVGLVGDTHGRLGLGAESQRGGNAKVARVAFGQSVMVTPLAVASVYAAVANNGVLMKPRLVMGLQDGSGRTVKAFAPTELRRVLKPETTVLLTDYLEAVVESGTGKGVANVPGYRVAGKTGTAQKVDPETKRYSWTKYVASFVGYLPASNPRAVVYVLLDSPSAGKTYGGQVAAPAFRNISQQLMWYWKVPPDDPASAERVKAARR
jgi:cell division protein FtsI/penicillin-binding protein 2